MAADRAPGPVTPEVPGGSAAPAAPSRPQKPPALAGWRGSPLLWGALALAVVVLAALLWYPPLWQGGYQVAHSGPFAASAAQDKLNVNTASAEELELLPGIGEQKARAILRTREQNGPFRSIDDLQSVRGIGPKIARQIEPYIVF